MAPFQTLLGHSRRRGCPVLLARCRPPQRYSTIPSANSQVARDTQDILRSTLLPLNDRFVGPLERKSDERTPLPLVFILGNHSSGKSTFINYALKRRVQDTGVAPTDDSFTIIAPGSKDSDQDGPALVGQPEWGFRALSGFGPSLVGHVRLKVRSGLALDNVILVDSPGMIDSPTDSITYVGAGQGRKDRGYDFEGVARWLADKADVILLFFDPDKPGTTGETLSVLTNSLQGMDHKFLICLNKADVFERTSDFARTYGALTWNLSKVIPRKDLPRIFTTSTPLDTPYTAVAGHAPPPAREGGPAQAELAAVREEIVAAIRSAPSRRLDNMITQLDAQTRLLKMHVQTLDDVRAAFQDARRRSMLAVVAVGGAGVSFCGLGVAVPEILGTAAVLAVSCFLGAFGLSLYNNAALERKARELVQPEQLDALFRKRYARELMEKDESVAALWLRVRPAAQAALTNLTVPMLPRLTNSELKELDRILQSEVHALRKRALREEESQKKP